MHVDRRPQIRNELHRAAQAVVEPRRRRTEREATTPLRRLGDPADIGGIAVFLSSKAAAFITGQVIVADGGVTI